MTGWKQGSLLVSLSVALSATAGGAENWIQERAGLPCGPTRFTPGGW